MQKVARVIIGISTSALNRLFTYAIPTDLVDFVEIGSVVYVPFGKGNSEKTAYVIDIGAQEKSYDYELKSIRRIAEEVSVEKEMIQLAYWMHRRYRCTLTSALKLMLPRDIDVKLLTRKTIIVRKNRVDDLKAYAAGIKNNMTLRKRHEILEFMENVIDHSDQDVYCFTEKDIITMFNTSTGVVKGIENWVSSSAWMKCMTGKSKCWSITSAPISCCSIRSSSRPFQGWLKAWDVRRPFSFMV